MIAGRALRLVAVPVRVTYLLTCLVAFAFAVWTLYKVPRYVMTRLPLEHFPDYAVPLLELVVVAMYGGLSARGLWRVARRRPILGDRNIANHTVTAVLVTLAAWVAHFLFWTTYPDFDGNGAGPLALVALLYLFALLVGEVLEM